ncbi:ADAM 17-like protease [Saccoglossus kowalevskii]
MLKLLLLFTFANVQGITGSLHDALHYFETLHLSQVTHQMVRRDADTALRDVKQISFSVLGRDFNLHLFPTKGILSSDFKAYSVKGDGRKDEHIVKEDLLYHGYTTDEQNSYAKVMIEKDGLTASIKTPDDVYIIEPSWRHVPEPHDFHMIAYKGSDMKYNFTKDGQSSFCGHGHHLPKELQQDLENYRQSWKYSPNAYSNVTDQKKHSRSKRRIPSKNICQLLLVADYRFFETMGRGEEENTVNYMISLVNRVKTIYKDTYWAGDLIGLSFEIKEILVHTEATFVTKDQRHYNERKSNPWDVSDLLEVFSVHDYSDVCLAHLFTYQDFSNGVLGLAYIATARSYAVGGICSDPYYSSSGKLFLNTGLTTTLNWGRRILTREADLVTAHELGHNFGSEHDPDTKECSPDDVDGGKYIMYPAAVSGLFDNNKLFSPCSQRFVGPVLESKINKCFTYPSGAFCGNFQVEAGEECDAGLVGLETDQHNCCSSDCYLKNVQCSDANSECCVECSFATAGMDCRVSDDIGCIATAQCTGNSDVCPESQPKANHSDCVDDGKCYGGRCYTFCETKHMLPCMCPQESESCYRCCHEPGSDSVLDCNIYTDDEDFKHPFKLPDGQPCGHGFCQNGYCEKSTQDVVKRLWSIIEDININKIVKFMEDNIVGTIIILSLLIWVPCSCLVHYVDKKRDEEAVDINNWLHPTNRVLIRPEDEKNIQKHKPPTRTGQDEIVFRFEM